MDVSKAIVAHLTQELGCRVSTERPASPPDRMVTAVRLGGGGSMFRETSRYAIHAWAASEKDAYKLGMEAAEAMFVSAQLEDAYLNAPDEVCAAAVKRLGSQLVENFEEVCE